jgi:hypothetical protein
VKARRFNKPGERILLGALHVRSHGLRHAPDNERHRKVGIPDQPERGGRGGEIGFLGQSQHRECRGRDSDQTIVHQQSRAVKQRNIAPGDRQRRASQRSKAALGWTTLQPPVANIPDIAATRDCRRVGQCVSKKTIEPRANTTVSTLMIALVVLGGAEWPRR